MSEFTGGSNVRVMEILWSKKEVFKASNSILSSEEQGLRVGDEDEVPNTGNENLNPIGSQQSTNTGSQPDSSSSKNDIRREKSLGVLTQNFVKLFLCSDTELISLDEAAKLLLGDGHNSAIMRNTSFRDSKVCI